MSGPNPDREKYKVTGAEGADKDAAVKVAIGEALVFAARKLTGSDKEKQEISKRKGKISALQNLAKAGKVTKTTFNGDRPILDIIIDVNVKDLRIQLETERSSRARRTSPTRSATPRSSSCRRATSSARSTRTRSSSSRTASRSSS